MITPSSFVLREGFVAEFLDVIGPWAAATIAAESRSR